MEFRKVKLFFGDSIRKEVLNGFTLFYSPNFLAVVNKEGVFQAFLFEYEGCSSLSFPFSGSLPFENVEKLEIFAPFGFYSLDKNSCSKLIAGVVLRYRQENFLFGNLAGSKFFYIGSSLVNLENLPVRITDEDLRGLEKLNPTVIRANCRVFESPISSLFNRILKKFKRKELQSKTFVGSRKAPDFLSRAIPVAFSKCGKVVQVADSFFGEGPYFTISETGYKELKKECVSDLQVSTDFLKKPMAAQLVLKKILKLRLLFFK